MSNLYNKSKMTGLGTYLKGEYEEIRRISEDKEDMADTYEEWRENKIRLQINLQSKGIATTDVIIHPVDLREYCVRNGLKINGRSRAQFVQSKVKEQLRK